MIRKNQKLGKIFISYRRSDTQGYAGRLSDSLTNYFGENRIFRDIDNIKGGSEFAKDIKDQVSTADAVIILIGPDWVTASDGLGQRRIDDQDDWVVQEIISAINQNIPIFPVLIEGTALPRKDELPEELWPVLNYNAITISDRNWDAEVLSLGKIISFDIPTRNESRLFQVQVLIYTLLGASVLSITIVLLNSILKLAENDLVLAPSDTEKTLLIHQTVAAIPFYVVVISIIILSICLPLFDQEKKKYVKYSIGVGAILSTFFFFGFVVVRNLSNKEIAKLESSESLNFLKESLIRMDESLFIYFGSILTATLMFILLGLSGFKPK